MIAKAKTYVFGDFRFIPSESLLLRDEEAIPLTPKAVNVLESLVENAGSVVTKDDLIRDVWDDMAIEDSAVSRTVFLVRAALGDDPKNHTYIQTVPKRGYRFVAVVSTLNGSNGHAIQPEQTVDAHPIAAPQFRSEPIVETRRFSTAHLIGGLVLLAAVTTSSYFGFFRQSSPAGKKSLLVLPVTSAGDQNGDEVLENGLADALIYQLASSDDLMVRPLSVTRSYSGKAADPIQAGREQKVNRVLSATYQRADGKVRVTARLINVETGASEEAWKSETGDGSTFAIQDAVAADLGSKIAQKLGTSLGPVRRSGTSNEEAYRLYVQGRNLTMKRNQADHLKAIGYFEQAIAIDPNFASAYARMAAAVMDSAIDDRTVSTENVDEMLSKALELDPNCAEAYVNRASVGLLRDWNLKAAEKDLVRAIELEPNNDTAHWVLALVLSDRGLFDEALKEMDAAQAIDPGAVAYMFHRGRILYYARRYDAAIEQLNQTIEVDDRFMQTYGSMVRVYELMGDYDTAFQYFLKREERGRRGDRLENHKNVYRTEGWLGVRQSLADSGANNFDLARLYSLTGNKDAALEFLRKAVDARHWLIATLNVEPAFDNIRDDPRFVELVRSLEFEKG